MTHLSDNIIFGDPFAVSQDIRRAESLLDEIARLTFDTHASRLAVIALEIIK